MGLLNSPVTGPPQPGSPVHLKKKKFSLHAYIFITKIYTQAFEKSSEEEVGAEFVNRAETEGKFIEYSQSRDEAYKNYEVRKNRLNFLLKIADKNKNELIRFLKFKIKMEDLILGKVYEKMIREARIKQKKNKTTRIN